MGAFLRRLYSLRLALILQVVLPMTAVLLVAAYVGLRTLEAGLEARLEDDVELIARAIREPVSYSVERDETGAIREALESVFQIGRVYGAYVYDHEGELVAAVGAVHAEARDGDPGRVADGEAEGRYEELEGRAVYSYFLPLIDRGGRINGLLQVSRRRSDFDAYVAELRRQAGLLTGAATALVAALVIVGHRAAIGRHLHALSDSMQRIAGGDRDHRARAGGPVEIRDLNARLNTMLDAVQAADQELLARKRREAELERRLAHSERLAALGRLAAGVAHELGTPLAVIDGKAQRSLRDPDLGERQRRALERVRSEVDRMERIVRQLLDFGRPARGQRREVRVADIARRSLDSLRPEASERGVALELEGAGQGGVVNADPLRLEQALGNLVRNAIHAAGTRVAVSWRDGEDGTELWVDDDGEGFDEATQRRLFEPFFTTKAVGQGTGLGLAVVHGVVSEHGGEIEAGHGPLGGARFRIFLPRHGGGEEAAEADREHGGTAYG